MYAAETSALYMAPASTFRGVQGELVEGLRGSGAGGLGVWRFKGGLGLGFRVSEVQG